MPRGLAHPTAVSILTTALSVLVCADGHAQGTCEGEHGPWLRQCALRTGVAMQPLRCPPGKVIVHAGDGDGGVTVEVAPASERSFRRVGPLGASPVGEFADWSLEPEARRQAFDAVVSCLGAVPDLGVAPDASVPARTRAPWLLVGAACMLMLAALRGRSWRFWWGRLRERSWYGRVSDAVVVRGPAGWAALAALTFVTWAARQWIVPTSFFHQNGQGPLWVEAALLGGESPYGSGYEEVFGWVAGLSHSAPDRMVFLGMSLVAAASPAMVWLVARCSGADSRVGWLLAGWAGVHPLMARLAQGESYLAVQQTLILGAAAILAWAGRKRGERDRFLWAVLAAGFLIAQAARIHPTSWLPAAVVPLVLLAQPGRPSGRVRRTALAAAGIATVVAGTAFGAMWDVYTGPLGQQWAPTSLLSVPRFTETHAALVAALAAVALLGRFRVHAGLIVGAASATLLMLFSADLLERDVPWVADAYRIQALPVLLATGVASLRLLTVRWKRTQGWLGPLCVVVVAALITAARWAPHRTVPTDALEQSWAMSWRGTLPQGTQLVYLRRAGDRILMLPLYSGGPVQALGLEAAPGLAFPQLRAGVAYYRSSLCSTPEGSSACATMERGVDLEVIEEREFPAIASQPWAPLAMAPVKVGLYRVRALPTP